MNKAGKGKAFQKELHKVSDMFKERLIIFFLCLISILREKRETNFISEQYLFIYIRSTH